MADVIGRSSVRVLGICGGCQMLGTRIADPDGVEGGQPQDVAGLGLLPFETVLEPEKVTQHRDVTFPADLPEPWAALRGVTAAGYEIRNGRTPGGPVWASGRVLATTVHGLLEDPDVVERLVGRRPPPVLEETFDLLADAVDDLPRHGAAAPPRPALSGFSLVSAGRSTLARCDGRAIDRDGRRAGCDGVWRRASPAIPAAAQASRRADRDGGVAVVGAGGWWDGRDDDGFGVPARGHGGDGGGDRVLVPSEIPASAMTINAERTTMSFAMPASPPGVASPG